MRLHRFYTEKKIDTQNALEIHSADLINQICRVFRMKAGDRVVMFDGSGFDYECTISHVDIDKDILQLHVNSGSRSRYMPSRNVYLYAALVKKDTFEWITEKATELGVTHIIPVMAERSEKKNINEERLTKIVKEASEQSGRGSTPGILPVTPFETAVKDSISRSQTSIIAFHTEGELCYPQGRPAGNEHVALFIGPEGGWSPEEIRLFHKNKIPVVCLGSQVLRAETAVVAALSVVMLGK